MAEIRSLICATLGHVDHGKCVAGDTLIPCLDGTIISARELFDQNFDKGIAEKNGGGLVQNIANKKIQIFSFDGKNVIPKEISHIWRKRSDKLIEITTSSGDIIKTTPEHPFFTFSLNELNETRADELNEGEYVAVPKRIGMIDTAPVRVIIEKLKSAKNFVCFLNDSEISEIFIRKLRKQNVAKLERETGIKHIYDSIAQKRFRVRELFTLSSGLKVSDEDAYDMIGTIKNSNEGWRVGHTSTSMSLPKKEADAEKLGYVLGCLAGDGHIGNPVTLSNNDLEVQEAYIEYVREIFELNSNVKQGHTCKEVSDNGFLTFSRFLKDVIGFPNTKKTATISVPDIAKKNKEVFRGFFAGLFDTDGYVSHINYSIEITSKSKDLIKECSIILLNFGVHSVVYEKNSFYVLRIANKIYLNKFLENFRPRLKRKLIRIINASLKSESSRIFDFLPLDGQILKDLNVIGNVNKKVPYFTKYLRSKRVSTIFLKNVMENLKCENEVSKKLRSIFNEEVSYVKVMSKKEIKNPEKYVYDFTVPDTHNFVAERLLVHNTCILDQIRGTAVASGEAGGITQSIGASIIPLETIQKTCGQLIKNLKMKLTIPGLLFIDTPGHASFTSLRKRGGALADIAILVVDLNEGFKPQTIEAVEILKAAKTPFVVAANKVDLISGWKTNECSILESLGRQNTNVTKSFENKLYTVVGELSKQGFDSERFDRVSDYTKQIPIIPTSAKTGEGIPEILMVLAGLAQRFLEKCLECDITGDAKGTILEVKEEKGLGTTIDVILYNGKLKINDTIIIGGINGPIVTKVKALLEPMPLAEMRDKKSKFKPVKQVVAATGVKISAPGLDKAVSGMPLVSSKDIEKAKEEVQAQIQEVTIETEQEGIVVKADSIGSLEAMTHLLQEKGIPIRKANVGDISKSDISGAESNYEKDPLMSVILGFNVNDESGVCNDNVKIITNNIIYKILDDFEKWKEEEIKRQEAKELDTLTRPCKLEILRGYVFRQSNPAVFGVDINVGVLKPGTPLMGADGKDIGDVKGIQLESENVVKAEKGQQVAISMSGVTVGRQVNEDDVLYAAIPEEDFLKLKELKKFLKGDEREVMKKVAELKRKDNPVWGV